MSNFSRYVILLSILFCAGLCTSAGLAIAGPEVFILHDPIQPGKPNPVTFRAKAYDSQGITKIVISAELRVFKTRGKKQMWDLDSTIDVETCNYPGSNTSEECVKSNWQPVDTTKDYLIGYRATAYNKVDLTNPDQGYNYFAYFKAGTYPVPDDPIPIYVHESDTAAKIDLIFIPDEDYVSSNWEQTFMTHVTELIRDSFFSEKAFALEIRKRSEMWNFYITYKPGNAEPNCYRLVPNWATLSATVNSGFIVHKDPFGDCSGIGEGTTFSAEHITYTQTSPGIFEPKIPSQTVPIHELGHSVFSLADEYPGGYLFDSSLYSHNVFTGPTGRQARINCQNNAQTFGWNPANCTEIGSTRIWWRSDDGNDIMEDTYSVNNKPGPSGKERYKWHYDQCTGQNC